MSCTVLPSPSPLSAKAAPSTTPSTGVFGALYVEWRQLCSRPLLARTVRRWAETEPALQGLDDLSFLGDPLRPMKDNVCDVDETLLALLRLSQQGEQLAGRAVLQALLPKLQRMVGRMRSGAEHNLEDRRQAAIAILWELIARYPIDRRPHQVAANLALDTLHELTAAQRQRYRELPAEDLMHGVYWDVWRSEHHRLLWPTSGALAEPGAAMSGPTSDDDLTQVIDWGVSAGAISSLDGDLLRRVYTPAGDRPGGADAAAELGLSWPAARQRCSRAGRRLADAMRQELCPLDTAA